MVRRVLFLLLTAFVACSGCGKKTPPRNYLEEQVGTLKSEVQKCGGSWDAWNAQLKPFQDDVRAVLASKPDAVSGLVGLDGFLFFRRSLEVLVGGDLRQQKDGRDPFPVIVDFTNQLKTRNVDLLVCFIPVKAGVYPEKASSHAPPLGAPCVNVYTRKLMLELAEAGVECVDLLPRFVKERDAVPGETEAFYMKLDTHWSNRALRTAANVFAERIEGYPWYKEVSRDKTAYTVQKTTCKRRGDIVTMLPEAERVSYQPMTLDAEQVLKPDGSFYEDSESSPIVLMGDSYSGVFHLEDCKHGGLTAHIAKEIGIPIDLILGQGMGPDIRGKLARRGKGALDGKKLVIWTMSERDLYNYRSPWTVIPMP
jgi:alginate O-acetyltransferase complex protein AlgJ